MHDDVVSLALICGFDKAEPITAGQIVLDRSFRAQCASNACGVYGKCWMCPPDIGDIDALMEDIRRYPGGILYQSVFPLEDSFDFEGMQEGGQKHSKRSQLLNKKLREAGYDGFLHLGKGGCGVCSPCAKSAGEPCRFPEKALSSVEAYGVNVSATVKSTTMKYINGANTVTYFGMVLLKENAHG